MTSPSSFWQRWLLVVAAGTILFGAVMIVFSNAFEAFAFWMLYSGTETAPNFSDEASAYGRFAFGIAGAVMIGWMIPMLYLIIGPFRRGERVGWNVLTLSLVTWFIVDSVWSVATGFWQNAILNSAFLLLFGLPLLATLRHFYPAEERSPELSSQTSM